MRAERGERRAVDSHGVRGPVSARDADGLCRLERARDSSRDGFERESRHSFARRLEKARGVIVRGVIARVRRVFVARGG